MITQVLFGVIVNRAETAPRWNPTISTSTAVACTRLGVDFIGSEIDKTYLDHAIQRVRDAVAHNGPPKIRKAGLRVVKAKASA